MSKTNQIFILCPTYFDVESFILLRNSVLMQIETVKKNLKSGDVSFKFILIDDSAGSDQMINRIKNYPDLEIFTPVYNLGHQAAIVFGLRLIKERVTETDLVVTLDSDLEDNPEDISRLIKVFKENLDNNNMVVLAQRISRKESFEFKFMYTFFKIFFKILTGSTIKTGNFACFDKKFLNSVLTHPFYNLCYSSTFLALKIKYTTVPCSRGARIHGKSKMNFMALISHGLKMFLPFLDIIATRLFILGGGSVLLAILSYFFMFKILFSICLLILVLSIFLMLVFMINYLSVSGRNLNVVERISVEPR